MNKQEATKAIADMLDEVIDFCEDPENTRVQKRAKVAGLVNKFVPPKPRSIETAYISIWAKSE